MKKSITILLLATFLLGFQQLNACFCGQLQAIQSQSDLAKYDFVGYIKITGVKEYRNDPSNNATRVTGVYSLQVIELFKGSSIKQIVDNTRETSCDIGFQEGDEWIVFARFKDGKMSVGACDWNQRYRSANGTRDWLHGSGLQLLTHLRKLHSRPEVKPADGMRREYYSNGQLEIEETYSEGKLNGLRKIWYPNGVLYSQQLYINDTLDGKLEWFYDSGQLDKEGWYKRGIPHNVSRIYYNPAYRIGVSPTDSLNNKQQVQFETIYDTAGKSILTRAFYSNGKTAYEIISDPDRKFRTSINYHKNGVVSSIGYSLNGQDYGHYQAYDEKGIPTNGWDHDEKGNRIKKP